MNCKNCHQDYDENLNACPYCGAPKEQPAEGYQPPVQQQNVQQQPVQPQPAEQPPVQQAQYQQVPQQGQPQPGPGPQPGQQPPVPPQGQPQYQQAPPQYQAPVPPQGQPQYQQQPMGQPQTVEMQTKAKNMATASMVCGILGLILCWTPYAGLVLNILGIIFYTLYKKNEPVGQNGMATAGLVCSIIGLIVSIIFTIVWTTMFAALSYYAYSPWMWNDFLY
ncbi:DUF4190 domain-containing protein [Christensenella timonensis]|uniref:DUF4190 domain-containing protein n=1 Tax=Christensenella timonensis TaxID=1816678 RepID=UPI000830E795|nr:DUF4190 domain-containing protein [Christensenella timonensis]